MKKKQENRGNLQVQVSINKSDIPTYAALHDCTNATSVTVGGKTYKPRTLRFLTFAGRLDLKAKKYVGEYRFMVGDFASDEATDLNTLPGLHGDKHGI